MAIANPKVGVGVFVVNNEGSFILGKRKGSHGHGTSINKGRKYRCTYDELTGTWALPGGHLEAGESFEDCAAREVLEETNLVIKNARFVTTTNDIMEAERKHYVTVWVVCEMADVEAKPDVSNGNFVKEYIPVDAVLES